MSLAIDVDTVTRVLLADGRWYSVGRKSFALDAYEYLWWPNGRDAKNKHGGDTDPQILHGGGQSGVCAIGFEFLTESRDPDGHATGEYVRMAGPLTAIQAVEHS